MGDLFRSEDMTLCQLFLQTESAYQCLSELGELGAVQFRDMNPDQNSFQRKYVNEIRRCDEMQRRSRYLEKEARIDKVPILDTGSNPEAPPPPEMVDLETTLEKLESDLKEVNQNFVQLRKNDSELKELKYILMKAQTFFDEKPEDMFFDDPTHDEFDGNDILLEDEKRGQNQREGLGFFAGVITRDRMAGFERLLWRACRGTAFLRQSEITERLEDPKTGEKVNKCVVIIFYQGERLKARVRKICDAFHVTIYPCPEAEQERREMSIGVNTRIDDLNIVINQTKEHRQKILLSASQNLQEWKIKICKIKAIYHTLNMFNVDVTNKCLIGECWCPVDDMDAIQNALHRGSEITESSIDPILNRLHCTEPPPTYNRVNKLTRGFQNIVNSYGVADYQEANPAPFMVITFPFLFGVMFGDCGHGLVMFLFALWMVVFERYYKQNMKGGNEIWKTFFGGRYIILLMGAFAIYSGLLYNDCYSRALNIFGSSWHSNFSMATIHTTKILQLDPAHDKMYTGKPYPFGEDPAWQSADNKITFTNSMKMKLSVVLGVTQMMFGVAISCTNHVYFKNKLNIFCEFIPQVLFLGCIFVYLSFLFFWKWTMYTAAESGCAPSLLIGLINMFMFKYPHGKDIPCNEHQLYAGQSGVQSFLVIVAGLCVPWMLILKPAILFYRHKKEAAKQSNPGESDEESNLSEHSSENSDTDKALLQENVPEFNFGDICVHQAIHTIEYCLGCISNTASYLRLWALSLAHAELTEVLWMMVLKIGLKQDGYQGCVILFGVFAFWESLTIAILLLMEGLSAFLHALRLHWVEFQNKFYSGAGYIFTPFCFETLMEESEE